MDNRENTAANLAAPLSAHEATKLLMGKRAKVNQYAKVEPVTLYYRALGAIYAVPDTDVNRAAIEAIGSRVLPLKEGGVIGNGEVVENANAASRNSVVSNALEWKRGVANSVCNAKFKPYQRVLYKGGEAEVMDFDGGMYTIQSRDGRFGTTRARENEMSPMPSYKIEWIAKSGDKQISTYDTKRIAEIELQRMKREGLDAKLVCNAKFKVGDKVRSKFHDKFTTYTVAGFLPSYADDAPCMKLDMKPSGGHDEYVRPDDYVLANSSGAVATTNAVVNAALAWKKAVNFQPIPSFKVGQKVKFWDRNQSAYYDGIYSVKKVLNPYEVELEGSDGKMRPGNKCDVRRIVAA